MSGFTKSVSYTTTFDGDEVSMKLSRMSRGDLAKLAPFFQLAKEGGGTMKFNDTLDMIELASEILPRYVSNFGGLKDSEGELIDLDTVLEQSYFINLVAEMIAKLAEVSTPQAEDVKN